MTITDTLDRFRDRIDPGRGERATRAAGKSEPEPEAVKARMKATRHRRLLRSEATAG